MRREHWQLFILSALIGTIASVTADARGKARYVEPEPSPTVTASAVPTPSPTASAVPGTPMTRVRNITGASVVEIKMIREGEKLANEMLWSKCFEEWVLSAHYTENQGLTQGQILLNKIRSIPTDINVEMYYANNRTVGYEWYPFDGVVHMNRKHVFTTDMVADNLLHEDRGHSLGFFHDYNKSTSEPYGMNYAFEGCYNATQQLQMMGFARSRKKLRPFQPPGLRLEIRRRKK